MDFKKALSNTRPIVLPFVIGLSIYSLIGVVLFVLHGKEGAHALINSYHTFYLDGVFKYLTHLGDGLVPVGIFLLLLLVRFSWALAMGMSGLVMGIVVQTLKRSVFAGDHRPAMFFQEGGLPDIDGIQLMLHHSFPSGHSATALCVALLLALFAKQRWFTITMLMLALAVAFSRVYISQHFIQDTVAGAWIGFSIAFIGYLFIVYPANQNPNSKLNNRLWP